MTNEPKVGLIIPVYTPDGGGDGLTGTPNIPGNPGVPQTGENNVSPYVGIGILSASTLSTIAILLWLWMDQKKMKRLEGDGNEP